jgi:hypothetical protein
MQLNLIQESESPPVDRKNVCRKKKYPKVEESEIIPKGWKIQ